MLPFQLSLQNKQATKTYRTMMSYHVFGILMQIKYDMTGQIQTTGLINYTWKEVADTASAVGEFMYRAHLACFANLPINLLY